MLCFLLLRLNILTVQKLTDQTTQYARDVVSGKIVAGLYVRLACQRHIDDLKKGQTRGLTWDAESAQDAIEFFPAMLSITEGAKEGQSFTLLPWHVFVVGSIFGWKDVNGFIRFRFVWLETGKGQAKSPLMAAIGIYLQGFYGKKRAEVYCIGEVKDTARVMFRDAVAMLRAPIPGGGGETLEDNGFVIRGTGDLSYKVEHPASSSFMLPIANGDAVSGPKPIAVMGDEIHEMKSNSGIEIWKAAVAKKHGDSLMILGTNTPSVDQSVGTSYSDVVQKMLKGDFSDDSMFGYIARCDKNDDPMNDESVWIKALPALGITYPIENVRKLVETSKQMLSTALTTKRLYFGIPVGTAGFWCSEVAWEECQGVVDEEKMIGRKLHLSLDLSERHDLTAVSGCWEGDVLAVKSWYWTREFEIADRSAADHIGYRERAEDGEITITPGRSIDYSFIARQIIDLCAAHDVVQMVVDASKLENLLQEFDKAGFDYWVYAGPDKPEGVGLKVVKHRQGNRVSFKDYSGEKQKSESGKTQTSAVDHLCMPHSISHLEDNMLGKTIVIDRSKLTEICASNAVVDTDGMGNKMFNKKKSRGRIDGMVTIAMAVGSATSQMQAQSNIVTSPPALVL